MKPSELAAIKERCKAMGVSHKCADQRYGCERCETEAVISAGDVPALIAEVERLSKVVEDAKEYRSACIHLVAFGSDKSRGLVNESKRRLFAALDAAEGGE